MEFFVVSLINSLVYGMLLFMLSSGLTLIFSMMGILNLAHASFYMLAAYIAYEFTENIGFWPALVFAPMVIGLLGALVEKYGLRKLHKYGHVAELLLTFGLSFLILEVVMLIWGLLGVDYRIPSSLDFSLFRIYETDISAYRIFMLIISICMFGGLVLLLAKTRIGLIIRASITDPDGVAMLGHNVPRVFMWVFGGGTAMAGLAGVIGGNYLVTNTEMASLIGVIVFVVIVIGGMGSITGAFLASLLIGIVQTFAVGFDYALADLFVDYASNLQPGTTLHDLFFIKIENIGPLLPYLMMVLILIFRPKGLLGERES